MTARIPIRWKLTIWYAALLAAALILFGGGLYFGIRKELYDSFQEQINNQAGLALAAVRTDGGELSLDPAAVSSLTNDEHFVRLIGADGRVIVDTSASLGQVPLDPSVAARAAEGQTEVTTLRNAGGTIRIVTTPVKVNYAALGVLQVGVSRADADEVLRVLTLGLTIAAPIVLLLAAGGGYLLAGRALQPVASITALAGSVSAADLHTRLGLDLPDDELGRLARTFDSMLARIEDAFERQRRFTGDAAHELRTPLSFIRSQVDLALARERSPDEYREALIAIDDDLGRLTGLVGTLLTLARADIGHVPLERAPLDLAVTVGLIMEQYRPLADEAGITLVDESGPATLVGDEDLIIQVLVNLLDNAIAHTPAGGRVTVGCRRDGDCAHLWVADTGHGISIEHQSLVFDRFYRVDEGRSRHIGGAGLGLSICRAIVEAHGGSIALSSRPGAGTTVEICLPTQPPPDE